MHKWRTDYLEDFDLPDDPGKSLEISKLLFPRNSKRKTDTQVLSLLHGHDLLFRKFKSSINSNCNPYCVVCPNEYDDNYHRLLQCPRYNSEYRDTLVSALTDDISNDPISAILKQGDPDIISSFRKIAQITMERWKTI